MEKVPAGLPEPSSCPRAGSNPASAPGSAPLLPGASWCWRSICNALGGFVLADGPCEGPENLALAQHQLCHPPAQEVVMGGSRQPCPPLLPPLKGLNPPGLGCFLAAMGGRSWGGAGAGGGQGEC